MLPAFSMSHAHRSACSTLQRHLMIGGRHASTEWPLSHLVEYSRKSQDGGDAALKPVGGTGAGTRLGRLTVATLTALLEGCVLYPQTLRDLLLNLARTDLFRADGPSSSMKNGPAASWRRNPGKADQVYADACPCQPERGRLPHLRL